jgi:hypothetical protein
VVAARERDLLSRRLGHVERRAVRTRPGFEILLRTRLFEDPSCMIGAFEAQYDVAPDGRRLILVRSVGRQGGLSVMLNWFENLRAGGVGKTAGAAAQ